MIEILSMTDAHVLDVANLEKLCFSDPWSENSIANEVRNPLALWLVAIKEGMVIGYIGSQSVTGEADMMNLAVHPNYRRQGVAKSLVEELVNELKKRDVNMLTLEVRASNESAKQLYFQNGFVQVGRRPNYYRNPKEDAFILRREWTL